MITAFKFLVLSGFGLAFDCTNASLEIGLASRGFTINEETLEAARSACYQVLKLKLEQGSPYGSFEASDDVLYPSEVEGFDDEPASIANPESNIVFRDVQNGDSLAFRSASYDNLYSVAVPGEIDELRVDATTTHTLPGAIMVEKPDYSQIHVEDALDDVADAEAHTIPDSNVPPFDQDLLSLLEIEQSDPLLVVAPNVGSAANLPEDLDVDSAVEHFADRDLDADTTELELVSIEEAQQNIFEITAPAPPKSRFEELLELYPELLQYTWPAKNIYKMNVYKPTRVRSESLDGQKRIVPSKVQRNLIKHNIVEKSIFSE